MNNVKKGMKFKSKVSCEVIELGHKKGDYWTASRIDRRSRRCHKLSTMTLYKAYERIN